MAIPPEFSAPALKLLISAAHQVESECPSAASLLKYFFLCECVDIRSQKAISAEAQAYLEAVSSTASEPSPEMIAETKSWVSNRFDDLTLHYMTEEFTADMPKQFAICDQIFGILSDPSAADKQKQCRMMAAAVRGKIGRPAAASGPAARLTQGIDPAFDMNGAVQKLGSFGIPIQKSPELAGVSRATVEWYLNQAATQLRANVANESVASLTEALRTWLGGARQ